MLSKKSVLVLLLCGAIASCAMAEGHGDDTRSKQGIDAQIEKILTSPPSQRRILMNRFKEELATMNRRQRMEAIERLREHMHSRSPMSSSATHGVPTDRERLIQQDQMDHMKRLGDMEEMGHRQGMDQYMGTHFKEENGHLAPNPANPPHFSGNPQSPSHGGGNPSSGGVFHPMPFGR